jgi:DNA-binding response OmpR family regulator
VNDIDIVNYLGIAVNESKSVHRATLAYLEDDPAQQAYVAKILNKHQYLCRLYTTANDITNAFLNHTPCDIALLDWDLGSGESALEVVQFLRATQNPALPIIILSARQTPTDVMMMLNAGASDFLPKPVIKSDLHHWVSAYLSKETSNDAVSVYGGYQDDPHQKSFTLDNEYLGLSPSDYTAASLLFKSSGRLVPHRMLAEALNPSTAHSQFLIESQVHRLKKKLRLKQTGKFRLESYYGCGYRLTQRIQASETLCVAGRTL